MFGGARIKKALVVGIAVILAALALIMAGPDGDRRGDAENTGKAEVEIVSLNFEMYHSPACNCCKRYAAYLREMNYTVRQIETTEVVEVKNRFGVPRELWSCHTIKAGKYFIEGHVPAEAIEKLMTEKPDIDGIALAGMPPGSPGMGGNKTEPFRIYYISGGEKGEFMVI